MALRTGDKVQPFSLPHKPKEMTDVGQYLGKEPVVLLFFPFAFSSVCTKEMCHMRDTWSQWQSLGVKVFGITVDSPFVTDLFRTQNNVPFPILSDFNREVAKKFDVLHADLMGLKNVTKRAVFVIGAHGKIIYDWVSEDPSQFPDFDAVQRALKEHTVKA